MHAPQTHPLHRQGRLYSPHRFARFKRKPKFAVDLPGAYKIMRMRVDAGFNPEQDIGRLAAAEGELIERLKLIEIIDDDLPTP